MTKPNISFSKTFFDEILKKPSSDEQKKLGKRLDEQSINVLGVSLKQLLNNIKRFKKREDIIKLSRIIHEVASEDRKRDGFSLINKGSSDNSTPTTYMEMIYIAIEKSIEGRFNQFIYDVVLDFLHNYVFHHLYGEGGEVERNILLGLLNIKRLKKLFRDKNLEGVSRIIIDTIYGYFSEGGELNDEEQEPQVKEYLREKLQHYYLTKYK